MQQGQAVAEEAAVVVMEGEAEVVDKTGRPLENLRQEVVAAALAGEQKLLQLIKCQKIRTLGASGSFALSIPGADAHGGVKYSGGLSSL